MKHTSTKHKHASCVQMAEDRPFEDKQHSVRLLKQQQCIAFSIRLNMAEVTEKMSDMKLADGEGAWN
jgi:hypothetical protein